MLNKFKYKIMKNSNPGKLVTLPDGRTCIIYNSQPLVKEDKILLHLVDKDYKLILDKKKKPKTIIKDFEIYIEECGKYNVIGYVD